MSAPIRTGICLLLLLTFCHATFSQTASQQTSQQAGTGTVSGAVKMGEAPAAGITLALMPDQGGRATGRGPGQPPAATPTDATQAKTAQTTTDDKGLYTFSGVAAGKYRVALLADTLVVGNGDPRASGIAVTVSDGQAVGQMDFKVAPGGVITGRVSEHNGRPVIAQRISLMLVGANGQPQAFNGGNRLGYETDDRGVYRVYGLPAGRYLVSSGIDTNAGNRPGVNRRSRYPLTYYPNATDMAQAQAVELTAGNTAESIDIALGEPLKTYAVTGRAVDAETGEPVTVIPINVGRPANNQRGAARQPGQQQAGQQQVGQQQPGQQVAPGGSTGSGATNLKGEFRVTGLMPGRYSISVNAPGSEDTSSDFYNDPVTFEISSDDASGVEVKVHRGASINGIVIIDGSKDPAVIAQLAQLNVSATSRGGQGQAGQGGQGGRAGGGGNSGSGRQSSAQVNPDGTFRVSGLAPGTVRLNLNGFGGPGGGSSGFSVMRIERNGAAITGDMTVASGEVVSGVRIIVGYGTGVIQGNVIVSGTLPAGTRMMITARQTNSSSTSSSASAQNRPAQIDARGNFRIEGLLSGTYELRLTAITGGFAGPGGGGRNGGGRGGQQGTGQQGGVVTAPQIQIPEVRQTVTVVNGQVAQATLTLTVPQQ
ncbi:MAG: hypothetical protein ABIU20_02145 [Blastocatellia bacterium]